MQRAPADRNSPTTSDSLSSTAILPVFPVLPVLPVLRAILPVLPVFPVVLHAFRISNALRFVFPVIRVFYMLFLFRFFPATLIAHVFTCISYFECIAVYLTCFLFCQRH